MGHSQHTSTSSTSASGSRHLGHRTCLRKGCGRVFQAKRWNQRYCGAPDCQREVRRWQAAKRQRRHRQKAENRQRHAQAQRERRQKAKAEGEGTKSKDKKAPPNPTSDNRAWSRGKKIPENFCDRCGCYQPKREASRAEAKYCSDGCASAVRKVLNRECKWLRRHCYGAPAIC